MKSCPIEFKNITVGAFLLLIAIVNDGGAAFAQERTFGTESSRVRTLTDAINSIKLYGATFDQVVSTQILPSGCDEYPITYVITGYWKGSGPRFVDRHGQAVASDADWIFERPLKTGEIQVYFKNDGDIQAIIDFQASTAAKGNTPELDAKLRTKAFWTDAACTGGRDCGTKTCSGTDKCCQIDPPGGGRYCECLKKCP